MPNAFAYIALFSWPLVTFALFRVLSRPQALIASILGGYLFLPFAAGVDFPMIPTLDKTSIPSLSAVIALLFAGPRRSASRVSPPNPSRTDTGQERRSREPPDHGNPVASSSIDSPWGRRIERGLLLLLFLSPVATVLQNSEPYIVGASVTPGLTAYDAASMMLDALIAILPYLLARRYLTTPRDQHLLLIGLAVAGLLYSIPTLAEVRLSPQMSNWVYGFLAQSFGQAMRDGGFRPVVFLQHGLWLAIFLCMTTIAAFVLWRKAKAKRRWLFAGLWLLGTLVLCHSLGALAICIVAVPIVLLLRVRGQLLMASAVAIVILLYPALRTAGLIPVEQIASMADSINTDRGQSLQFRLDNEDRLLAHANAKPLFGWGAWARADVFTVQSGDISITDGMWIITIGQLGWLGYIAQFGLLIGPILFLTWRRRLAPSVEVASLAVVLAANLTDMIPNATLTPVTWLLAGSLAGTYIRAPRTNLPHQRAPNVARPSAARELVGASAPSFGQRPARQSGKAETTTVFRLQRPAG